MQGGSFPSQEPPAHIDGLQFRVWRPSALQLRPPAQGAHFAAWWGLHQARVFKSRQYSVLLARELECKRVIHRTCVMPAWFRWPFMHTNDIQISDTWTHPDYRGRGIASFAAGMVVRQADGTQTVWYATQESNASSLSVCRTLGMQPVGTAVRTDRFGFRILGSLVAQ
mgnify:CR=1 FL=1